MGTWVADYVCEPTVMTLPPVTMAPGRPSVNSCGMDQMTALLGLSQGDMSQVANLGDECGPCILADPDDPCPCMDSTMCPLASCTPEECVYSPDVSEATTTTTTTGGTTTKPVFKPTVEVKVKAVTVFDEPLTEEAQESVKEVFCEEVQETVAGE